MPVILDSNLLVALVSGDPRGNLVSQAILDWVNQGINLHAPELARYEFANALTRLIVSKAFPSDRVDEAWNDILVLPITYHSLQSAARVVEISLALKRQNAYDAAYLALAESLNAELQTLDGPLYPNATGQGFNMMGRRGVRLEILIFVRFLRLTNRMNFTISSLTLLRSGRVQRLVRSSSAICPGTTTRAIKGHKFGLDLSDAERKELIAFLKSL